MNTNDLKDLIEFIAPYDDELFILFLGDNPDTITESKYMKTINKTRNSMPGFNHMANKKNFSSSDVFRNKAYEFLSNENCILVFNDPVFSANIIKHVTNTLADKMEAMLIDNFIIKAPQNKFIFNLANLSNKTLNAFTNILDQKHTAFNYYIVNNTIAIWITFTDNIIPLSI